ncbi:MAG: CoA transferase, partial [Microbacterium sp.]|nr:CoA transferase [Microbacterium sp.]
SFIVELKCRPGSALAKHPRFAPAALAQRFPAVPVVSVTPFGLDGPWAGRAATEFTLQAWAGGIGWRGTPGRPPVAVGGRVGEWVAGVYAANALLDVLSKNEKIQLTGQASQGNGVVVVTPSPTPSATSTPGSTAGSTATPTPTPTDTAVALPSSIAGQTAAEQTCSNGNVGRK